MNTITELNKKIDWSGIILFTLGFWMSASLLLDVVIMPCLSATGMMTQESFASASYVIFETFNHIELICGAMVLSTILVFRHYHNFTEKQQNWATLISISLLIIAIIYTYIITPQLSAWGLQFNFNLFNSIQTMPKEMASLQGSYWVLEGIKLLAGMSLLKLCYTSSCSVEIGE